ncbi:MAG: hypothetical protein J6T77_02635 [Clostridia bacterium]|nr:hypothetical protein [Clostridia bacterium]
MLLNEYANRAHDKYGYIFTSPATRALMVTKEGAPLIPDGEWKEIETYLATSFWNNRLYNPTQYKTDPDVVPYRRFFEHTVRSHLVVRLDEFQRVYEALHISFLPSDRTFQTIDDAHADDTTRSSTTERTSVRSGDEIDSSENGNVSIESGQRSDVVTEAGSTQRLTDAGTPSGSAGVGSGPIETSTEQYIGFNSNTPHDNTRTVREVDPTRTIENESFNGRTTTHTFTTGDADGDLLPTTETETFGERTHTYNDVTDTESGSSSDETSAEGEAHRTVSGWGGYDIEASIAANIEIAKTCVADLIAETIRKAVILTDAVPCRCGNTEFMRERRTWGELEGYTWGELSNMTYEEIEEGF